VLSVREMSEQLATQAAAELKARKKVVLTLAKALGQRAQAVEHLAKAERDVSAALQEAGQMMTLAELAQVTGESATDLRRLARAATDAGQPAEPAMPDSAGDKTADDAPDSDASPAAATVN
jgi:hypothetical protein